MNLAAVILAGGASRRMGRAKALLPFRGETILDRLIGLYARCCDPVIVVLGHQADAIRAGIARGAEARFAVNPDPERGQLSSLQTGLALAPGDALFTPVDYPAVEEATVRTLVSRFAGPGFAAPSFRGAHGHPVLLRAAVVQELLALPPAASAREVIDRHRGTAQYINVEDAGVATDIDRIEDYERLLAAEAARE